MSKTESKLPLSAYSAGDLWDRVGDLKQRSQKLAEEARSINDKVDAEGRGRLSDGEMERHERLVKGMEKLKSEERAVTNEIVARTQTGEMITYAGDGSDLPGRGDPDQRVDTSAAKAAALRSVEKDYASDDTRKESATKLVESGDDRFARYVAAIASPEYLRAWSKLFKDPVLGPQMLDSDEARALDDARSEMRAMTVGTDSGGGYGTPLAIDPTMHITAAAAAINPFASMVKNVNITTDKWRGLTTAGATASWDGERSAVSDDSITLANTDITVHKLQVFVPASIEVTQDYPAFATEIAGVLSDAAMRAEHTAVVSGTGTDQPWGWQTRIDGGASEIAPTAAEVFAETDVYKVAAALGARHWPNARWAMHRGTSFDVRQFADGTTTGQHAFWADFAGGVPSTLLGKPVHISEEMNNSNDLDSTATADNFLLAVADWEAAYVRVVRVGFNIELIPHLFDITTGRPTGERGFYGYLRLGGDVLDSGAIKLLSVPTTA